MKFLRLMASTIAISLAVSVFAANQPVVRVDLTKKQVIVTDVSPGTDVLIYGYGAATNGLDRKFQEWHEIISDDDKNGEITYTPPDAIPWRSLWVAVDLRNAKFGVGLPPGFQVDVPIRPRAFHRDGAGLLSQLTITAPWISGVYVHPGGGAWLFAAQNGAPSDVDGSNDGLTTVALTSFTPLASPGERPKEFAPGGILIVVDPFYMRLDAVHLDGAALNDRGAQ